jgi:hypothetical protein
VRKIYHVALVLCLLSVPATAQDKSDFKLTTKIESSAQYWAGVSVDYFSTKGKKEKSPLIRSDNGGIDAGRYFAINGGVFATTFLLDRKYPRVANWTRRILGWVHLGVGVLQVK